VPMRFFGVSTRDNAVLVRAFITYVHPLVEYNSVVWSPHMKRDIVAIEKVQKRFTMILVGLKGLPYAERLKSLSLTSLELRRLHNDLLWCYKIVFGLVDITCDDFFPVMYLVGNEGSCIQDV